MQHVPALETHNIGKKPRGRTRKPPEDCKRNPEIHRRYRARKQEQAALLEAQVLSKLQELNYLLMQNVDMRLREKILKTYIAARDEQLKRLELHAGARRVVGGCSTCCDPSGQPTPPSSAPCHGSPATAHDLQPTAAPGTDNKPAAPAIGAGVAPCGGPLGSGAPAAPAHARGAGPFALDVSDMTQARVNAIYAGYVEELSRLVPLAEGPDGDPAAYSRAEEVVLELDEKLSSWMWLNPACVMVTRGAHLFNPGEVADPSLWRDIAARVCVGEEKIKALGTAFQSHQAIVAGVVERRQLAAARLREVLWHGQQDAAGGDELAGRLTRLVEMVEAANALRKCLDEEGECWLLLFKAMHHMTPPFSRAKVSVMSYPYWPDGTQLFQHVHLRSLELQHARQAAGGPHTQGESMQALP